MQKVSLWKQTQRAGSLLASTARMSLFAGLGLAVFTSAQQAQAGGFAIREQSASSQGASFAGSAAGHDLSSMYWNPAAAGVKKGPDIHMESHYSVIMPFAEVTVDELSGGAAQFYTGLPNDSGDIAPPAIVGASYASYQLNEKLFLGLSVNSPFGLTTKPRNDPYQASSLARTSRLLTFNASPTLAYELMPGVTLGAGVQVQYADGKFSFRGSPFSNDSAQFEGDDFAFGGTAGVLLRPATGTSLGIGYRSRLTHKLDGDYENRAAFPFPAGSQRSSGTAEINLPDIVTVSFRQALAPNLRIMGTYEWSNWSRFEELAVEGLAPGIIGADADNRIVIDAGWSDGHFFSAGGEYDMPNGVTLRAGIAYEISPVDSPEKRILGIPDSDRVWLSGGATFGLLPGVTMDVAYTHIFLEDAEFDRTDLSGTNYQGSVEAHTDIISLSLKTKW